MSLYQFLLQEKKYSEAEAEETVLRWELGLIVPTVVKQDIKSFYASPFYTSRLGA